MKRLNLTAFLFSALMISTGVQAISVQIVTEFPDIRVKVVSGYADCTIKFVDYGANYWVNKSQYGKVRIQRVSSGADFTVKEVTTGMADVYVGGTRDIVAAAAACPQA